MTRLYECKCSIMWLLKPLAALLIAALTGLWGYAYALDIKINERRIEYTSLTAQNDEIIRRLDRAEKKLDLLLEKSHGR